MVKLDGSHRRREELPSPCPDGKEGAASDEDLFIIKPPKNDECPICCVPLPIIERGYKPCCWQVIAMDAWMELPKQIIVNFVPFAEHLHPFRQGVHRTAEEKSSGKLCWALWSAARSQQNKANKLRLRAGGLGDAGAYNNLVLAYHNGVGVERDEKKAKHYCELAAMGGDAFSRHNLGVNEENAGNIDRAVKHWMIAAGAGDENALTAIQSCFMGGHVTKDDFEMALRAHKKAEDETKSA
jgi:hypothetical protein